MSDDHCYLSVTQLFDYAALSISNKLLQTDLEQLSVSGQSSWCWWCSIWAVWDVWDSNTTGSSKEAHQSCGAKTHFSASVVLQVDILSEQHWTINWPQTCLSMLAQKSTICSKKLMELLLNPSHFFTQTHWPRRMLSLCVTTTCVAKHTLQRNLDTLTIGLSEP